MTRARDQAAGGGTGLPLAGIHVIDISHIVAGPFCGAILADFGADMIKVVEPPGRGERGRGVAPFVERGGGGARDGLHRGGSG